MGDQSTEDNSTPANETQLSSSEGAEKPAELTPRAEISAAAKVLDAVRSVIDSAGPEIRQRVVAALSEKTISERVELTKKGLDKYNEARSNLRKLDKPDHCFTDGKGTKLELMSAAKSEEVKKARETCERIEKALKLALEENNFSKLQECCK